jgi:chemotaxis protein CheY-P-specific phosphatase CheC
MDTVQDAAVVELEALWSAAIIGARHASRTLSCSTDRRIDIDVSDIGLVHWEDLEDLADAHDPLRGVAMWMLGDVEGLTVLTLSEEHTHRLCDVLLPGIPNAADDGEQPLEQATLNEVGDVLGTELWVAIGDMVGKLALPSSPIPILELSASGLITPHMAMAQPSDDLLAVTVDFAVEGYSDLIRAYLLLLPDPESLHAMLRPLDFSPCEEPAAPVEQVVAEALCPHAAAVRAEARRKDSLLLPAHTLSEGETSVSGLDNSRGVSASRLYVNR